MNHILVRIGRLPGRISEIALNGDRTVAAALEAAELDSEGYELRVNGQTADVETTLQDGDTVLLVKKIKGN
jgi:sulfur carrier protein ThiS